MELANLNAKVAGIQPTGNQFQALNSHLADLINPMAASNLGTVLERRGDNKRGKRKKVNIRDYMNTGGKIMVKLNPLLMLTPIQVMLFK